MVLVAGAGGIEPTLTVLETVVLPLYDAPSAILLGKFTPFEATLQGCGPLGISCYVHEHEARKTRRGWLPARLRHSFRSGSRVSILRLLGSYEVLFVEGGSLQADLSRERVSKNWRLCLDDRCRERLLVHERCGPSDVSRKQRVSVSLLPRNHDITREIF